MNAASHVLAQEVAALKAALATAEATGLQVVAELAVARAKASEDMALIAQQKLRIAKLERQIFGQRSERSVPDHRAAAQAGWIPYNLLRALNILGTERLTEAVGA